MQKQDLSNSWVAGDTLLSNYIQAETTPFDLISSWENLGSIYSSLGFTDELTDERRIEEFKWIIKEMNKFLTRERKALITARDEEAAFELLSKDVSPNGDTKLEQRKQIVFHKLRQSWVLRVMHNLDERIKQLRLLEEAGDSYDNDGEY